jgi:hypothetical protein
MAMTRAQAPAVRRNSLRSTGLFDDEFDKLFDSDFEEEFEVSRSVSRSVWEK